MKAFRAIFCFYVVVWFNLVVPGHTRGVITLPSTCESIAAAGCCSADRAKSNQGDPTPQQKKNCAICYVAATYTAAAWFTVDLAANGDVVARHREIASQIPSVEFPLTHYATGPPAQS